MNFAGKYYRAPLSRGTIATTIFGLIIIMIVVLPVLILFPLFGIFFIVAVGLILIFSFLSIPKGYSIGGYGIVISRGLNDITIPYDDISDIEYVGEETLISSFSIGVRGFFGWSCTTIYEGYGRVMVYSRRLTNMVLIYTGSGSIYAIAPEEPEIFIKEVELEMKGAAMGMVDDEGAEMRYLEDDEEGKIEFAEVVDY